MGSWRVCCRKSTRRIRPVSGLLNFRLKNAPKVSYILKGIAMSNENSPVLPDSSNLDAWKKAASKSAPGGDVEALNWVTSEGIIVKPLYTKQDTRSEERR